MSVPLATQQENIHKHPNNSLLLKRYVFLLLDSFSQLSFNCALEALNLANGHEGKSYFSWLLVSEDGKPVKGSNGLSINVDSGLPILDRRDTIIVCGGANIASVSTLKVLNWLRREARKGVSCGAIDGAAYTLAIAGLLKNKTATTHWEYHSAFAENFPEIELQKTIYTMENNRFTCAGGVSSIDLMLHLIGEDYGQELAGSVADQMVYTAPRTMEHTQKLSIQFRIGTRHKKFAEAISLMNQNTEFPLPHGVLAKKINLSTRQLERLFRKYLSTSPKSYYTNLRLEKARSLLLQTDMSIGEIGIACGFNSQTHFSKCYRKRYGNSPSLESASHLATGKNTPQNGSSVHQKTELVSFDRRNSSFL